MNRALIERSLRDSWPLLAGCCVLTFALMCLRVWFVSRINIDAFLQMLADGFSIFQSLLPVSLSDWISPLGRTVFTYEEPGVILLLALWTVARGSESIVGRVENGNMEMLLAQPVRRFTVVASHSVVSLAGVFLLGAVSFCALAAGLAFSKYELRPELANLLPASVSYVGFGVFWLGAATLVSAWTRTRGQAVAIMISFYVAELALTIIGRLNPNLAVLESLSILSAYEPTRAAIQIAKHAPGAWSFVAITTTCLFGLGIACWAAASASFCQRDVPAPL